MNNSLSHCVTPFNSLWNQSSHFKHAVPNTNLAHLPIFNYALADHLKPSIPQLSSTAVLSPSLCDSSKPHRIVYHLYSTISSNKHTPKRYQLTNLQKLFSQSLSTPPTFSVGPLPHMKPCSLKTSYACSIINDAHGSSIQQFQLRRPLPSQLC